MTNKKIILNTARELVNLAIKKIKIVQPFVKPKHYVKGLVVLNGLYLMLKFSGGKDDSDDGANNEQPNQPINDMNP